MCFLLLPTFRTALIMACIAPEDVAISQEQFLRFVKSQQSQIQDVAFAFEGERRYLGPPDKKFEPVARYQGRYALRSDSAMYQESYFETGVNPRTAHRVRTMVGNQGEMASIKPTFDPIRDIEKIGAGPGSFFDAESPQMWAYLHRFQTLKGTSDFSYDFLGWEEIDGHRCIHFAFNPHPEHPGKGRLELWVDLERGAHPLRIRDSDGDQTVFLVDQIKLSQFPLPSGETVWFPVGGRFNQYFHKGKYTAEPTFQYIGYVLNSTILFNQGLKDGVFHVMGEPFRPQFAIKRPAQPPRVTKKRQFTLDDVATAEQRLDAALADTSRRPLAKNAAVSTQQESGSAVTIGWGLGLFGTGTLLAAAFLVARRFRMSPPG